MNYLDQLQSQFNHHVNLREKRPGILQLVAPLYHEDGDMVDIFLDLPQNGNNTIRVSDYGMTFQRLSYSFDLDTPNKERIFQKMLSESQVSEENGALYMETAPELLYPTILQFAQTVARVSNMRLYKREVIENLFYELLDEFVQDQLPRFNPQPQVFPLPQRDDLEVDYRFQIAARSVFLLKSQTYPKPGSLQSPAWSSSVPNYPLRI